MMLISGSKDMNPVPLLSATHG